MVAMPLVLASIIFGVTSINDLRKLSRIDGRILIIYISTTMMAITIGLILIDLLRLGYQITEATRNELMQLYSQNVASRIKIAVGME